MNPSETAAAAIPSLPAARAAGIAIAAATVLSIIFVALDGPASGSTPLEILQSMAGMRTTKEMVHSVAIASVLAYCLCLFGVCVAAGFTASPGIGRFDDLPDRLRSDDRRHHAGRLYFRRYRVAICRCFAG